MRRRMLKSKLHRARVTHADIDYEGSLSIDENLLLAADIVPWEEVYVWNVTRGTRLRTYAMKAAAGSGVVCINGAAAHHVHPGDIVIIATFVDVEEEQVRSHSPTVVLLDLKNRATVVGHEETPGPDRS